MLRVTDWFELECAVLDVEVVGEAFPEGIQDRTALIAREDLVLDHDVHGQHGHAGRQRPHM